MRKYLNKKRKSEMVPKPGLLIKYNKGTQTKKKDLIKCKSGNATMSVLYTKQQNAKNNMIDYTTQNMKNKKYKN